MSTGGLILAGDVRLGFYNSSGAFLGYAQDAINVTEMTLTPGEGETRDRISRQRDTYGQALDSITLPEPWTMTFTTDSIGRDILKALFLGEDTDVDVASGSITSEEIVARTGKWVPTSQVGFTTGTVSVTGTGGSPTHAEDTDYLVDLRNGAILAIDGGAITAGATIEVSADYGARAGFRINAAKTESLSVALLVDGRSLRPEDSDKTIRTLIHKVNLRPAGGNDLMSDEWVSPQFGGTMVTPSGKDEPFYYEEFS